eukprot:SAG31_NODE_8892_length_1367_cov_1.585962_2_plen_115_part_00
MKQVDSKKGGKRRITPQLVAPGIADSSSLSATLSNNSHDGRQVAENVNERSNHGVEPVDASQMPNGLNAQMFPKTNAVESREVPVSKRFRGQQERTIFVDKQVRPVRKPHENPY